jgi:hypothetical protein
MLTLKDLDAAKKFLKKMYAKDYDYYSPEQDDLSHELCTMSNTERSDAVEVMVMSMFDLSGQNTYKMGGLKKKYDLWANDEKIEVKSSLARKKTTRHGIYYTYSFVDIKPECFDRLVLVYISPEGLKLRILTKRAVYARISGKMLKRGRDGYSIYHNKNSKMIGQDLYSFLGLTTDKNKVESNKRRQQ